MAKLLPTDFVKNRKRVEKALSLPVLYYTSLAKSAVPAAQRPAKRRIVYSIDSLEKLTAAFEENERALKAGE